MGTLGSVGVLAIVALVGTASCGGATSSGTSGSGGGGNGQGGAGAGGAPRSNPGGAGGSPMVGAGGLEGSGGHAWKTCAWASYPSDGGPPATCSLEIPRPMPIETLHPDLVDIRFTPDATGVMQHLRRLTGPEECAAAGGNGWFFDSPATPTKLETCPGVCSMFGVGVVEVDLGCTGARPLPK